MLERDVKQQLRLQLIHPNLMAQYWDSGGKPSDGMLYGHIAFLGI